MDDFDPGKILVDVFRAQAPKEGDRLSRRVLGLFLRKYHRTYESYVSTIVDLEDRGWLRGSGEFFYTTAAGAKAFAAARPSSRPPPALPLASRPRPKRPR